MLNGTLRGLVRSSAAKRCKACLTFIGCAAVAGWSGCNQVIERAPWSSGPTTPDGGTSDAGTAGVRCGDLRPWLQLGVASPEQVVIDGTDGFVGYAPHSLGIFTSDGKYAPRIFLTIPFPRGITLPVTTATGALQYDTQKTWMVKARAAGSTLAVLTHCQYSGGYCGSSVYFSDRKSFSVDALLLGRPLNEIDISSTFPTYYAGFALDSGGRTLVAAHQNGTDGAAPAVHVKKLDKSHHVLAEARIPLSRDETAHVLDVQVDASGRVAVLHALRPRAAEGPAPIAPGTRLSLLSPDLAALRTWTAPANVTVRALAFDGPDHLWLAGSVESSGVTRSWLDRLETATFTSVRLAPSVGARGAATALDLRRGGGVWLAGVGSTEQTAWLEPHDASGNPAWPYRSELTTNGYFLVADLSSTGHFKVTGVAEQSDGSVLVSSTSTYRYEVGTPLTFPANAAPPASCVEGGSCDCSRRGWEP
jgi:hypothetical protein